MDEQTLRVGLPLVNDPRFSLEWIDNMDEGQLASIIESAGKQNLNAAYMKGVARTVLTKHNGRVPRDYKTLKRIHGIGPKTAGITIKTCHNEIVVRNNLLPPWCLQCSR